MSYSVSQVAKALSVSPSSVRLWSGKFSEHLSASATPASGEVREYTEEDIAVLQTVTVMRRAEESYKKIDIALGKGERREFVPEPEPEIAAEAAHNAPGEAESEIALKSFTETLNALQTQNTTQSEYIKELQDKLIESTAKAAVSELLGEELARAREEAERLREELATAPMLEASLENERAARLEAEKMAATAPMLEAELQRAREELERARLPFWKRWGK